MDGELQTLPVLGGRVSVTKRGQYAVLTTDIGLTVKYDWRMNLYITVPSSYYKHLGGLCGNYNGDRRDDLPSGDKETRREKCFFSEIKGPIFYQQVGV